MEKMGKVDCEQSLFFSKIRGQERKTSKRVSMIVSVTCECRYHEPLVARALEDEREEMPDIASIDLSKKLDTGPSCSKQGGEVIEETCQTSI